MGSESSSRSEVADTIYTNATVYTVDAQFSVAEAFAVKDGRILKVGRTTDVLERCKGASAEVVDLNGKTVIPGLIDAHGHFSALGGVKLQLDLWSATSYEEAIDRVVEAAGHSKPGEWIVGRRWDHTKWGMKEFPNHAMLSEAVPDHPVFLTRTDGHTALVNRRALELAGITDETADPPGGDIRRDSEGHATGILVDRATGLVRRRMDRRRLPLATLAKAAQEACFRVGLTTIHDAGVGTRRIEQLKQLYDSGDLKIRMYVMLSASERITEYFAEHPPLIGYANDRLTVRACKVFVDGAMGSHGAWMFEPYNDRPVNDEGEPHTGLMMRSPEFIRRVAQAGLTHGYQICTHAIGDRGNREVLDAYEAAFQAVPGKDHRFRIEHAQCVTLDDVQRFARMGVIPSMQQSHVMPLLHWVEQRVGPQRAELCFTWRRFYDAGCRIAGGSDFPVEDENPMRGIYAGITRQDPLSNPRGGWYPSQRQTREEALRSFTIDAAYAGFEEDLKGSLEPGKLADFVILERDIMGVVPSELLSVEVSQTVVGGQVVYRRQ